MGKRSAIFVVIILVLGLAILGYFLQQGRKNLLTDPYKAISPSACIVIETVDLQSFINSITTDKGIMGEAGKMKGFENFNRKIKFLADQLNKTGYNKILNGNSAVISFHLSPAGELQPLLSLTVLSNVRSKQLKEILKTSGINTVNEIKTAGYNILELPYKLNKQSDTAYISVLSGLLVCSSSARLLEEAARQTETNNDVRNLPGFSRILQASGKNEDKVFLIFSNLNRLLKSALKEEFVSNRDIDRLTGCAVGDIYLNENGLVLSGYTESIDSTQQLYKYKSGAASAFETYKILPSSTVLFESIVPSYLNTHNKADQTYSSATADLALKISEYTGDEITKAFIDIKGKSANANTLIIYELTNRVYAEKIFLDQYAIEESGKEISFFNPDDQVNIPIYLSPFKGFSAALVPGFAPGFDDSYFAFYDNYLITGSSSSTISRFLYDNLLNKTLANDLIYRDFESTLPSVSGYFVYCVPSRITGYLRGIVNDDIIKFLESNKNSLSKIQAAGYQFTPSNDMIYNSLSVQFKEEAREESTTEWETLLDSIAAIKPFFFTNHLTGAKEIFIQDLSNNAYLINAAGRVMWKVPLRERITGAVYMIDYFRNGKYQLLFSGKNYLHMLDRNGNYVERYPVKLRSPATNSLALFDYDNNRNYRLLIAGEDKMVYAYDKTGSVVKGWKPFRTNGTVSSEISWFRVSGKDYLVISDESAIYFIDRTGNTRLALKEPVTKARGSSVRLVSGTSPSLVCSGPDGTIQHIYFDGSVNKFTKRKFSVDHSFDIFDINGDGFGEYIFIDNGILYLYDHNRSEMFSRKFGSNELGGPISFTFSASDRKIGVFDINKKQIYLIDRNGDTMNGFPLRGASMFSIGKLTEGNEWNLIVGGTDRFLYNYKLDTETK